MVPPFIEETEVSSLPSEVLRALVRLNRVKELMDLVDLELSGRDGEVADLKQTTFSRERQQGVHKVEEEGRKVYKRYVKVKGNLKI